MAEIKLKPCLCGGDKVVIVANRPIKPSRYDVWCPDCGLGLTGFNNKQDAIKVWNRRVDK